jgi:hypothetical protein
VMAVKLRIERFGPIKVQADLYADSN